VWEWYLKPAYKKAGHVRGDGDSLPLALLKEPETEEELADTIEALKQILPGRVKPKEGNDASQ
jgi:hypothetical protein